jgi:hypothetical protein
VAKNRDRRREHKPEPPKKGDPPALRKARPDLLLRVYRHVHDDCSSSRWRGWTAMEVAKALHEHVDDVTDCLLHMIRVGQVSEQNGTYYIAPTKPPPPPPPKVRVNPSILLRVRKVFDRVATAKLEDFGGLDGVKQCIDELVNKGWLAKLSDGSYHVLSRTNWGPNSSYSPVTTRGMLGPRNGWKESRGSGVCPWCGGKTRRHARTAVHDKEACRLLMISNIMAD